MMASSGGRGFCLRCLAPLDAVPLVSVASSVKRFIRIKEIWERAVREYNKDAFEEQRIPLVRVGAWPKKRAARGGRPPKLTESDMESIRWSAKNNPRWDAEKLSRRYKVSTRTIRRVLKRLGLKLKRPKPPIRRSRRP